MRVSDVPQISGQIAEGIGSSARRNPIVAVILIAFIIMGGMIAGLYMILHYADIRQDEMNKAAQAQAHERLMFILEHWEPKQLPPGQ